MSIPIRSGPYKTFRPLQPGESFLEYEGSTITIPLTARIGGALKTAEISLRAFMRLEVFPPYINGLGTREFQFIIRDWDLHGISPLLNELFYGNPLGGEPLKPGEPRRMVAMTFNVSRHFDKFGDDDNSILAPVKVYDEHGRTCRRRSLDIANLTGLDLHDGTIFWQVEPDPEQKGKWAITFHNAPLDGPRPRAFDITRTEDRDFLVARETGLSADEAFRCTIRDPDPFVRTFAPGDSVISRLVRPRKSAEISWQLGPKPRAAQGSIRMVSPPKSLCTADQRPDVGLPVDSADFPARIYYAANYHIYLNDTRFVEDQSGVAIAVGVDAIPPVDVTVAFDKPHAGHVLGKYLEFGPGHCTGMHPISVDEYEEGIRQCELWRHTPLAPVA